MSSMYRRKCKVREDESPVRILTRYKITANTPPSAEGTMRFSRRVVVNSSQQKKVEEVQKAINKGRKINFEEDDDDEEEIAAKKFKADSNIINKGVTPSEQQQKGNDGKLKKKQQQLDVIEEEDDDKINSQERKNKLAIEKHLRSASIKYAGTLESRTYDSYIHCGVPEEKTGRPCVRSLTCKIHKKSDRGKVERDVPLKDLLEYAKIARQSVQFMENLSTLNAIGGDQAQSNAAD